MAVSDAKSHATSLLTVLGKRPGHECIYENTIFSSSKFHIGKVWIGYSSGLCCLILKGSQFINLKTHTKENSSIFDE